MDGLICEWRYDRINQDKVTISAGLMQVAIVNFIQKTRQKIPVPMSSVAGRESA